MVSRKYSILRGIPSRGNKILKRGLKKGLRSFMMFFKIAFLEM